MDVPSTDAAAMLPPACHVRDRQPLHEGRQIVVPFQPRDEMPVVRHQAARADPRRAFFQRLGDDLLERFVVGGLREQPPPAHAAIEDMENHFAGSHSGCAWNNDLKPICLDHQCQHMNQSPLTS